MDGMKTPTISGLKASLRCANEEARSYLHRARFAEENLESVVAERDRLRNDLAFNGRLITVLMEALEMAHGREGRK